MFLIPTYLICQNLENENIPTGLLSQFGDMYTTSINELNDEQRSQLFIKLREIEVEEITLGDIYEHFTTGRRRLHR